MLKKLLDTASQQKNPCAHGFTSFELGSLAVRDHQSEAETYFQQAEKSFTEAHSATGIALTHYQVAHLAALHGKDEDAARLFGSSAQELDAAGDSVGTILARLEQLAHTTNPPDTAFADLLTAAKAQHLAFLQANILHFWGDRESARGDYSHAVDHYEQADKLFVECRCRRADRAYVQTSIGRIMRLQGRPRQALPHYRLAMKLQVEDHDPSYLPQTINAMAVAYNAMGKHDLAIATYKHALAVARQIKSEPFVQFLEANLGYAYMKAGKPRLAIPLLERAVARQTTAMGQCIRDAQLAEAYILVHRLADAEREATKGVNACEVAHQNDSLSNVRETRAQILLQMGRLEESLTDAQAAQKLREEIRSHLVPEDTYKQGYMQRTMEMYDTSIEILMRLHRNDEALETAEQARARAFLDLIGSSRTPANATRSKAKIVVASEKHSIPEKSEGTLENFSPALLKSDAYVEATSLSDISSILGRLHSTLVAYWIANGKLYTWVMRSGQPSYGTVQTIATGELERLIRQTSTFTRAASRDISPAMAANNRAAWRRLYDLLIQPIESHLPKETGSLLTIIPSGPLFRVSFSALVDHRGRYLIERFALHTSPAIGLFRYTDQNDRQSDKHADRYLFVANPSHFPAMPGGRHLPPLPGTEEEVKAIARMLPAEEVILLDGDNASTSQLLTNLPRATVLHIATHAVVSNTDPFGSFLALNTDTGGGKLTIAQVYGLRLHTKLVVLSACRTGLGEISADGVAGLSRAFFYSGAASILATLWDIADEPTARLLPNFYRNLRAGESRSAALRHAQLALISDLRHKRLAVRTLNGTMPLPENPVFWAGFSLSGEP